MHQEDRADARGKAKFQCLAHRSYPYEGSQQGPAICKRCAMGRCKASCADVSLSLSFSPFHGCVSGVDFNPWGKQRDSQRISRRRSHSDMGKVWWRFELEAKRHQHSWERLRLAVKDLPRCPYHDLSVPGESAEPDRPAQRKYRSCLGTFDGPDHPQVCLNQAKFATRAVDSRLQSSRPKSDRVFVCVPCLGDSMGREELCRRCPRVKFLATFLSRVNQHEATRLLASAPRHC